MCFPDLKLPQAEESLGSLSLLKYHTKTFQIFFSSDGSWTTLTQTRKITRNGK